MAIIKPSDPINFNQIQLKAKLYIINYQLNQFHEQKNIMAYYIIIRGPLGCGKTTIAKKLSKILNAEYIAIDDILDKHNLIEDQEGGYISQASFQKVNEIILGKAKKLLAKEKIIVFDGNFYWKSQIEDLINKLYYPHYIFTLKAPLEVCLERDSKRRIAQGQDAVRAVYKKSTEFEYGTVIDITNKTADEVVGEIKKFCF